MTLLIDDDSITGRLVNLSLHGALLEVPFNAGTKIKPGAPLAILYSHVRIPARVARAAISDKCLYVGIIWTATPRDIEVVLAHGHAGELLYDSALFAPQHRAVGLCVVDVSEEIKRYLAAHPERLHDLTPRGFEILVASILKDFGLDVELTQSTRDGGVDIYAYVRNQVASFLLLVECKKWAPDRPVGLDVVQRLYGIHHSKGANKSLIVTTSYFTAPAQEQCRQYYPLMELKDFEHVKAWLLQCAS